MSDDRLATVRHLAVVGPVLALALLAALLLTALITTATLILGGAPIDGALARAVPEYLVAGSPASLAIAIVGTAASLGVAALVMASRLGPLPEVLRLRAPRPLDLLWSVIGMIAVSTAAGALVSLLDLVDEGALAELNARFLAMPMGTRLLMLPATALAPGIAEELFFRGWVLSRGERFVARGVAVVVSAVAFGLVHFDPGHVLAASVMGLFLAFVAMRTGSLLTVIVAHVLNNTLATLAPELNGSTATDAWWMVVGLVGGLVIGGLMMVLIARRHPAT